MPDGSLLIVARPSLAQETTGTVAKLMVKAGKRGHKMESEAMHQCPLPGSFHSSVRIYEFTPLFSIKANC